MSRKAFQTFVCAAAALFLGTLGVARAAFYDVGFDPEFDGNVRFQIGNSCLLNADGVYASTGACILDLVFADVFTLSNPGLHYTSGFQGNVGIQIVIAEHQIVEISTDPPVFCGIECSADLTFFRTLCDGTCTPAHADLAGDFIQGTLTDGYELQRVTVPEPGILSLLLGGAGAAWLSRRRKRTAG